MYYKYLLLLFLIPTLLLSKNYQDVLDINAVELEKKIESLFEKKEYENACKLVEEFYKNNPYSVQANLYYGKCAYYRDDIDSAMAAYDRAEILDEEDADVHKHLGDLHAHIGNIEIANSEYDKADRFGKDIVERALDSAYSSNSFSILARFSAGYDSNVAYNSENIDEWNSAGINDFPSSDSFTKEYIRLTHTYDADAFSAFYYKNQAHVYNKNYSKLSEEDLFQAQVYSGPGWASKSFDFWIPASYLYIATDYNGYAKAYSINPQIRKRFENEILLRVEGEYIYKEYLQRDQYDKNIYTADVSLSKWFGSNYFRIVYRYLQVDKESENSTYSFIDKYFNEVEINYAFVLSRNIEFGIGCLYNKTIYDDVIKEGDLAKREDFLQKYSAYVSYNITKYIGLSINYDNYFNETNYTPSDYKKEVVGLGVYFYY